MRHLILTLACVGLLSSRVVGETIIVDDHFDDDVVDTNTKGIGTGFNYWDLGWSATVTEADSKVTLTVPIHGGSRCSITSKEGAALGKDISRFEFIGVSFAVGNSPDGGPGGPGRNCVGVKQGRNMGLTTGCQLVSGFSLKTILSRIWVATAVGMGLLFYSESQRRIPEQRWRPGRLIH